MSGTFMIACSYILRYKRCHRLHQGAWDEHGKVYNLAGNAITRRSFQSQSVYKGAQSQERKLCQAFLKRQGKSDSKEFFALWIKP